MRRIENLVAAVLFSALALPAWAADAECKLARIAEWPVRFENDNRPMVDGAINGKKVNVLVRTSAAESLVTMAASKRLDLRVTTSTTQMYRDGQPAVVTRLDELRIGTSTVRGLSVRVGAHESIPGVDFILGSDFLSKYDVEYDYAGGFIRIFQPVRCVGGTLAYWDANAHQVGFERGGKVVIPVTINGKQARAQLDSGVRSSYVVAAFAEKLGLTPKTPGVWPVGCVSGPDTWSMSRFDSVEIGNQVTRDARLYIVDGERMYDDVDMYLGGDFLNSHRVLLARSRGTMYFSHVGSQIFRAVPGVHCDERLKGKKTEEARAAVEEALAKDPRDARALLQRAALRGRGEPKETLPDLDAVIAMDPSNPVPYTLRADARELLGDYAGALADSDAAMERGTVGASTYAVRGRIRWKQGDLERAMHDFAHALRLDPRSPVALRTRGRSLYHVGRYEEAERDFTRLVAVQTGGVNSIWLSLARQRRGLDGRTALEEGRGRLEGDKWPAPVLDHLLGRIDRDALMAKAGSTEDKVRREHECEARYYIAARLLVEGKPGEARPLLAKAAAECPRNYIEHESAVADLKALS